MVTYEQAAVVIPPNELQGFFNRNGLRLTATQPQHIAKCMRDVVNKNGKPALDDLQNVCKASLKKMLGGGCGCSGDCDGCGKDKTFNAIGHDHGAPPAPVTEAVVIKQDHPIVSFAKNNKLTTVAIILVAIWVFKKL